MESSMYCSTLSKYYGIKEIEGKNGSFPCSIWFDCCIAAVRGA
jgi:hypothetical protein